MRKKFMLQNRARVERVNAPRNVSELAPPVLRRLNSYALAASAAGVTALACSVPAACTPVCKSVGISLIATGNYALNPAGQAIAPFNLGETNEDVSSLSGTAWNRGFLTPNSARAKALLSRGLPAALAAGARIGPGSDFGKGKSYGMLFTYGPANGGTYRHHLGNLRLARLNYLGFKFSVSGQDHYGWVRIKVTFSFGGDGPVGTMQIQTYGYETTPNTAILAGQCSASQLSRDVPPVASHIAVTKPPIYSSPDHAPTSHSARLNVASLGLLALGASGLPLRRREEDN